MAFISTFRTNSGQGLRNALAFFIPMEARAVLWKYKRAYYSAFTIVELLIVVVVIAILAAISIVAYTGITARANDAAVQSDLKQLGTKIENYKTLNGAYPHDAVEVRLIEPKVTKSAYGVLFVATSTPYGLTYCSPTDADAFALVARSSSGQAYSFSSMRARVDAVTVTGNASGSVCSQGGVPIPVATPENRTFFSSGGSWMSWVGGS